MSKVWACCSSPLPGTAIKLIFSDIPKTLSLSLNSFFRAQRLVFWQLLGPKSPHPKSLIGHVSHTWRGKPIRPEATALPGAQSSDSEIFLRRWVIARAFPQQRLTLQKKTFRKNLIWAGRRALSHSSPLDPPHSNRWCVHQGNGFRMVEHRMAQEAERKKPQH